MAGREQIHGRGPLRGLWHVAAALVALALGLALAPGTALAENVVDLSTLDGDYEAQNGDVLTGTLADNRKITVAEDATITLRNANITSLSNDTSACYAGITPLGNATIWLEGANVVKGGYRTFPGVYVAVGATLTIDGTGSLDASSNGGGCGVGGGWNTNAGDIVIAGGTVTATGSGGCAGIGGGYYHASCGNISISGGTVTATGSDGGAGIGGGYSGGLWDCTCGDIAISGGDVTATGGDNAAGIGGGFYCICGVIAISGGDVTATGGNTAAGIGGGYGASCGDITICDTVTRVAATKGTGGLYPAPYSVGAGREGICGTVTVGGEVGPKSQSPFVYPAEYPLWVGGTRVTERNATDVFGDGTVSYSPATEGESPAPATLTLNGASITQGYDFYSFLVGIYYEGSDPLSINVTSDNIIASEAIDDGILSTSAPVTIDGPGSLTARGPDAGIIAKGGLTISGGNVTAEGTDTPGYQNFGIYSEGVVTISGGSVAASGTVKAINGTVRNAIAGTGWTDMAGTQGQEDIGVNTTGQDLSAYKKVRFPALAPVTIVASDGRATFSADGVEVPVADMFAIPEGAGQASFSVVALTGEGTYDAESGVLSVTRCGTFEVRASTAATGTHDAGAEVSATLTVDRASVAEAMVTLSKASYVCNGKARRPRATVTLGGRELAAGADYAVSYKSNVKPGTATVTVTGEGNYEGTAKATFSISPAKVRGLATAGCPARGSIVASWKKVVGAKGYEVSWRAAGGKWSTKTAKGTSATVGGLKEGKRYEVRVRAKAGAARGAWSESVSRWLRKVSSVTAKAGGSKGTIKVSWAADKAATGGYVAYACAKKDGEVLARKAVGAGRTSATLTGLRSGKSYYVKVRPLSKASGTTYVGVQRYAKTAVKAK